MAKEIEIAFLSASTEFNFVRGLIEGGHIPDDVTIEVLTQAREHLIRRTLGPCMRAAIIHIYNATRPAFRDFVFGMSKAEVIDGGGCGASHPPVGGGNAVETGIPNTARN